METKKIEGICMEFQDVVEKRRSIRSFDKKDVETGKVERILENIKWTPSAHNSQEWEVYVVKDNETKARLVEAALGQEFIGAAPVVLVMCGNKERVERDTYLKMDVGMACLNVCLSAWNLGLGTCIVGAFRPGEVSRILKLPDHIVPLAIIPIGYPAEKPSPPKRREDYIHRV